VRCGRGRGVVNKAFDPSELEEDITDAFLLREASEGCEASGEG